MVQLQQKGFSLGEISLALQIGRPLVTEYLRLYEQDESPFVRQRLHEQLQRLNGRRATAKRGAK